jgi:hypothetical protein
MMAQKDKIVNIFIYTKYGRLFSICRNKKTEIILNINFVVNYHKEFYVEIMGATLNAKKYYCKYSRL